MMATILIFGKKRPPSPGQKQQITKGFHALGYSIISDNRFFRNDPELHYIPMINKDETAFTRKTWMVYHPAELENHLAKNFIEYVKEIDFENF